MDRERLPVGQQGQHSRSSSDPSGLKTFVGTDVVELLDAPGPFSVYDGPIQQTIFHTITMAYDSRPATEHNIQQQDTGSAGGAVVVRSPFMVHGVIPPFFTDVDEFVKPHRPDVVCRDTDPVAVRLSKEEGEALVRSKSTKDDQETAERGEK